MAVHRRLRRLITSKLIIRAAAVGWIVTWWLWLIGHQHTFVEVDGQAYWGLRLENLYHGVRLGDRGAFLYSPAVAIAFLPFSQLPYDVFYAALAATNLGALVYMLGWELAAVSLFLLPVSNEIARGNIHLLLALAIVIGFRHPSAWAWPLLTKVTPGVGLLWFVARRKWHKLGVALALTAAIAAVTFVVLPELWSRWVALLLGSADVTRPNAITQIPVLPRLALAAVVTIAAAWRGVPALVPVASLIALPAIWVNSLAMLVAVVPLLRRSSVAELHDTSPDQLPIDGAATSPRLARNDIP